MKKIVFTYGILAGAINAGVAYLLTITAGDELVHANNEWVGYLVMIIALSMIFVGVKQYRDRHLGGVIKFGKAFLIGLYITLIASLIYVGVWEVYMQTSDENFIETYQSSIIEQMQAEGASDEEITSKKEELEYFAGIYKKPLYRIPITFSEIFPVGLLISLVSAALLKNSRLLPAEEPSAGES